jgi:hypothetical protein
MVKRLNMVLSISVTVRENSLVAWRPLLDERVEAFLTILCCRDQRKTFGGVLDRAAEVGVDRAHEGVAADFHHDRRLLREPPRDLAGAIERGTLGHDLAEQAHAKRSRGIEGIAEEQRSKGLMLADQPRQLHEVNGRDQPDVDLGITEGRGIAGDDHVAGDRNGHAAGAYRAVNSGDGRLAHAVLRVVERKVEFFEELLGLDARLAPDDVEIEPGTEDLVQTTDDDGGDRWIVFCLLQRGQQRVDQRHAQRIDRRPVEHDLGDSVRNRIANQFSTHEAVSS